MNRTRRLLTRPLPRLPRLLASGLLAATLTSVPNIQQAYAQDADCGLQPPESLRDLVPVPRKRHETPGLAARAPAPVRRVRSPSSLALGAGNGALEGALSGKTIYVSAGHGWMYSAGAWRTQRGTTNRIVEDFVSAETVDQLLLQYLMNMGAYVVPVREADMSSERVIVDDESADFQITGNATTLNEGFGDIALPIVDASNPFASGGSRVLTAAAERSADASWTFAVPVSGDYNVYVGWVQDASRADDAHYIVAHGGGEAHFRVDQRRHGSTWVLLGRFHFRADDPVERRTLTLANDSATPGATLSADVARIGGGLAVISREGGTNGRPMFEHAARYYTQWAGAPASVWDAGGTDGSDDVGARSRFAAWEHEDGEDAVYVAWHSNAPNPARGTDSYAYGPSGPNGPLSEFTGVPGSLQLMDAIHSTLMADIRSQWDASWQDRGQHTAFFGEVNPAHNPEMPATLVEVAFHDTPADAEALLDPRFRHIAARAIANGVARYFASKAGLPLILPPAPPLALSAINKGSGAVQVCWSAAESTSSAGEASAYRVYQSTDGRAFDEGLAVVGTCTTLEERSPGESIYLRVSASNAGGESLPSEVVGARVASSRGAAVLIVGGFERLDGDMSIAEDLSAFGLGSVQRDYLAQMNDGSHMARHGQALAEAGVSFDGVSASALFSDRGIELSSYPMIDWFVGEDSAGDDPLSASERVAIEHYLGAGGMLFLSGSEMGWALVEQGDSDTQAFFREVLHAEYVGDDANTYQVEGSGAPFADRALSFDDFGPGSYDADYPDILSPLDASEMVLRYQGGTQGAGILWRDSGSTAKVLLFGFPFETTRDAETRAQVMAEILGEFGIEADPIDPGGEDPDDQPDPDGAASGGCGCNQGGSGASGFATLLLAGLLLPALRRRDQDADRPSGARWRRSL